MKRGSRVRKHTVKAENYFLLYLPDASLHYEMLENLESRYRVEDCEIKTIYGTVNGYKIYAGRKVAEKVERQTKDSKLFNVDVRLEHKVMAKKNVFPCSHILEDCGKRFEIEFDLPFTIMEISIRGDNRINEIRVDGERMARGEKDAVKDMLSCIESSNPDIILLTDADFWMPRIDSIARECGVENTISRTGKFRKLPQKSYWSYGKARLRREALIPEGRILIDTGSFNFKEGGIRGVLLASRLAAISPNLASRFSPGSLISLYEIFEALRRDIAVPFRKSDAERVKTLSELRIADRGGMIFQPQPGVYENVWQIDFTSMYPSIIVKYNLSPETIHGNGKRGFLAEVLSPLLSMRIKTKRMRCMDLDSILKWMLVTCFGYTGYRNAKFGRIEVHEEINRIGREILLQSKGIAEEMGFSVLHGIIDCLWISGEGDPWKLKERVEKKTGLLTELEMYNWITFLPMKDGEGAYNRYYGRLSNGEMRIRGVAMRRRDIPEYIRKMQLRCFDILSRAENLEDIKKLAPRLRDTYRKFADNLRFADPAELVIKKAVGRVDYRRDCIESRVLREYRRAGRQISPGMLIEYVVVDSQKRIVRIKDFSDFDYRYYLKLLNRAWHEINFTVNFTQTELAEWKPVLKRSTQELSGP
ncbi:type B DNA-directed DNA polymerase [Archaeoglobus neptunius]|uniref:type B DNA-directed DNA polymerase n=1 Tax=Archaeoglobus neptunius TaxID=2798580 RepID=UPI002ED81022